VTDDLRRARGSIPALRVGCDTGGTKLFGVAIDPAGAILSSVRRPTPPSGEELLDAIAAMVLELAGSSTEALDADELSVGLGIPGLVDTAGVLRTAPNLPGVEGTALAAGLQRRIEATRRSAAGLDRPAGIAPVVPAIGVDNDATCAGIGEWRLGAARGVSDALVITFGTGIGGAIIAGGQVVHGRHGFGGEVGHMVVDPSGPDCPCGQRGCWEQLASGSALTSSARALVARGGGRRIAALAAAGAGGAGDGARSIRGEHVTAAAKEGDPDALECFDLLAGWLGLGLTNLVNALDPELIVIGGGLSSAGECLLQPLRRYVTGSAMGGVSREFPRIVTAELGEMAGAIGAAFVGADAAAASLVA
jgi:glucokinase